MPPHSPNSKRPLSYRFATMTQSLRQWRNDESGPIIPPSSRGTKTGLFSTIPKTPEYRPNCTFLPEFLPHPTPHRPFHSPPAPCAESPPEGVSSRPPKSVGFPPTCDRRIAGTAGNPSVPAANNLRKTGVLCAAPVKRQSLEETENDKSTRNNRENAFFIQLHHKLRIVETEKRNSQSIRALVLTQQTVVQ